MFGTEKDLHGIELPDAYGIAFSREQCLSCWRKVGAVPLTRKCLESPQVRHEASVSADGTGNNAVDPHSQMLLATDFPISFGLTNRQQDLNTIGWSKEDV